MGWGWSEERRRRVPASPLARRLISTNRTSAALQVKGNWEAGGVESVGIFVVAGSPVGAERAGSFVLC